MEREIAMSERILIIIFEFCSCRFGMGDKLIEVWFAAAGRSAKVFKQEDDLQRIGPPNLSKL